MALKETNEARKARFKAMSSNERKAMIREKMKALGLEEGSGVPRKNLSAYDRDEIWDLIQVTRCLPEMQKKASTIRSKVPNKKQTFIVCLMIAIAFAGGIVLYYEQYPSSEIRRELSVDGMFAD